MTDVLIIGGGICGLSLLRELSRYNVSTLLLEKENDICLGSSKANSAIIHAGYDAPNGTKMAEYNVLGNALTKELCQKLFVPFKPVGSFVAAFEESELDTLNKLYQNGIKNGVPGLQLLTSAQALALEPALSPNIKAVLYAKTAAIVSPWGLCLALAENAIENGALIQCNSKVTGIRKQGDFFCVSTESSSFNARFVINCSGISCDEINDMVAEHEFTVAPSKGEYYLLDKNEGSIISHIIFQCPGKEGKGVLVAPTVDGNLIVGPNAEPTQKGDTSTTAEGLAFVKKTAQKSIPSINFKDSIRNFAGLRAITEQHDFIVGESKTQKGFFNCAGIKSPGLSSAPAIATELLKQLEHAGLELLEKSDFIETRSSIRFNELSHEERKQLIKENPLYGRIVCRCETVTEGEIVDALHSKLPPCSVDGVKRRCGAGMGRCQGGFCTPRVMQLISRELQIPRENIPLDQSGSYIITGKTKSSSNEKSRSGRKD